jgi:hypothetical protein
MRTKLTAQGPDGFGTMEKLTADGGVFCRHPLSAILHTQQTRFILVTAP